jgi:hypothetical protein
MSFGGNLMVVTLLGIAFCFGVKIPLGTALLFLIIAGTTLFHATDRSRQKIKTVFIIVPIVSGIFVSLASIYLFLFSFEKISFYTLLSFIFTGMAIAIPYIKALFHRFHPAQLLAFLTLIINLTVIFSMLGADISLAYVSLLFVIMSMAILLRWPGRGFVSLFTTDTVSSHLAFKLLVWILLFIPLIGLLTLEWEKVGHVGPYVMMAVLVVSLTTGLIILIWLNAKSVYGSELESYLMQEESRVHNINLKISNEDLVGQMKVLEDSKKRYADRLNYQDRFRDIAEGLG